MGMIELLFTSVGLAGDAFAASVCRGLQMKKINYIHAFIAAMFFGVFQAGMPVLGWLLGQQFEKYVVNLDHWFAFVLLWFIGGKMIYEAIKSKEQEEESEGGGLKLKELIIVSIATSIDALAVGITFAFLHVDIFLSAAVIGVVTFALAFIGVILGNRFGCKYKKKAEICGGAILLLIGLKILCDHLFV